MTQVSFYTGVAERLPYLCRLLRKSQQAGVRTGVCGPSSLLTRLDTQLWAFEPAAFVPHLRLSAEPLDPALLELTPILLVERSLDLPHRELLLNVGSDMPEGFEQFQRVLEVVSQDAEQMQAARRRWRRYEELGFAVTHHKVAA